MIAIRRLTTLAQLQELHDVEEAIWPGDPGIHVPGLLTMVKNGGVAMGAYDGDRMVGICYGFAGLRDGKPLLCSHVAGVLPGYRHHGLGERLKLAQREVALEFGYELMTWTYDPLMAPNASLNIAKLGCVVRQFEPNYYGAMEDALNAGLASDRFVAEWHLLSPRVLARLSGGAPDKSAVAPAAPVVVLGDGIEADLTRTEERLLVPVPADFQALRQTDMAAARRWREATGAVLGHYMGQGYLVTEFYRTLPGYLLERTQLSTILGA